MQGDQGKRQNSNKVHIFRKAKHCFKAKVSPDIGKVLLIICCCVCLFGIGMYLGLRASITRDSDMLGVDKPVGTEQQNPGTFSNSDQGLPGQSHQAGSGSADGGKEGNSHSRQETSVNLAEIEAGQDSKPGQGNEQEAVSFLAASGIIMPASGEIIKRPGWFYSEELGDWRYYPGIDIATAVGAEVKAVGSGTIKRIYKDETFGEVIVIAHGGRYETRYARVTWSGLALGQQVAQGQTIGRTSGEILHFQLFEDNEIMDPIEFLSTGN